MEITGIMGLIVALLLSGALASWMAVDARTRGHSALGWWFSGSLLGPIGLILWFVIRSDKIVPMPRNEVTLKQPVSTVQKNLTSDNRMKSKRQAAIIITLVVVLAGLYYFWWIFLSGDNFALHGKNEANRVAIKELAAAITLGSTREDVLKDYYKIRTDDLRLRCDTPTGWTISMPMEFSASDWILWLDFDQDRISAVRVRSSDGPKPNASPDDKAASNRLAGTD